MHMQCNRTSVWFSLAHPNYVNHVKGSPCHSLNHYHNWALLISSSPSFSLSPFLSLLPLSSVSPRFLCAYIFIYPSLSLSLSPSLSPSFQFTLLLPLPPFLWTSFLIPVSHQRFVHQWGAAWQTRDLQETHTPGHGGQRRGRSMLSGCALKHLP